MAALMGSLLESLINAHQTGLKPVPEEPVLIPKKPTVTSSSIKKKEINKIRFAIPGASFDTIFPWLIQGESVGKEVQVHPPNAVSVD